jgi:hypothetical protein
VPTTLLLAASAELSGTLVSMFQLLPFASLRTVEAGLLQHPVALFAFDRGSQYSPTNKPPGFCSDRFSTSSLTWNSLTTLSMVSLCS